MAKIVKLDVGGTHFKTFQNTLGKSRFFETLDWEALREDDGSTFVDADPDLFSHILQFLRRGLMPVFWDLRNGHDYPKYNALLQEAKHFDIPDLVEWLECKMYRSVVSSRLNLYQWADAQKTQYIERGEEEVHFVSDRTTYIRSVEFNERECAA